MSEIPADAITAAALVLHDLGCDDAPSCLRWRAGINPQSQFYASHAPHVNFYRDRAAAALKVAAPLIAAAERERIRRLAIGHAAGYLTGNLADGIERHDFADLIGGKT